MGRLWLALGAVIARLAQSPITQQKPPQPRFKSGVELVITDAIVDKDAQPVKGLTPDDFIVTLERQVRPGGCSITASTATLPRATFRPEQLGRRSRSRSDRPGAVALSSWDPLKNWLLGLDSNPATRLTASFRRLCGGWPQHVLARSELPSFSRSTSCELPIGDS